MSEEKPVVSTKPLTPGPWTAHHGWECTGPTAEHPEYCEVNGGRFDDDTYFSFSGHMGLAIARMAAAAPRLLAALEGLADVSRSYLAHMDADDIAALEEARAAIRAARTGE